MALRAITRTDNAHFQVSIFRHRIGNKKKEREREKIEAGFGLFLITENSAAARAVHPSRATAN